MTNTYSIEMEQSQMTRLEIKVTTIQVSLIVPLIIPFKNKCKRHLFIEVLMILNVSVLTYIKE